MHGKGCLIPLESFTKQPTYPPCLDNQGGFSCLLVKNCYQAYYSIREYTKGKLDLNATEASLFLGYYKGNSTSKNQYKQMQVLVIGMWKI